MPQNTETLELRIGMLRQWLNEDRIKDGKRFVTNEDIHHWLDRGINAYLSTFVEEVGEPKLHDFSIDPNSYDDVIKVIDWYKDRIQSVAIYRKGAI